MADRYTADFKPGLKRNCAFGLAVCLFVVYVVVVFCAAAWSTFRDAIEHERPRIRRFIESDFFHVFTFIGFVLAAYAVLWLLQRLLVVYVHDGGFLP